MIINSNKILKKALIGLSKEPFNIDGVNMILNNETL